MSFLAGCFADVKTVVSTISSVLPAVDSTLKLLGAVSAASTGLVLTAKFVDRVRRVVGGPYPSPIDNALLRAIQRTIIRITNKDVQRTWFPLDSITGFVSKRGGNNGHAVSGSVRDDARELITSAVTSLGARKYELSPSYRSKDDDSPDVHVHYAPGDLALDPDSRSPTKKQVVVGVDVDYYMEDVDGILEFSPAVFYTFSPTAVAGRDGDSTFRIKNNTIDYSVSGGSRWSHKVWNWCDYGEFLEIRPHLRSVADYLLSLVGLRRVLYVKVFHSRPWQNMPHRALVWILPQYTHYRLTWVKSEINARRLERVNYQSKTRPGWNTIVKHGGEGEQTINLGREGEDLSISLPKEHHDLLLALGSTQSVSSRMIGLKYTDVTTMTLFSQYYTGKSVPGDVHARIGNPVAPRVHWPAASYADVPEISARAYGSCVVSDEAMMPMIKRWETLSDSLDRRVTFVHNDKMPKKRLQALANVYVRLVCPEEANGVALSLEDTAARLDKPSQTLAVKAIWETLDMEPRKLIESFVKNEPCTKAGRIISSFPDARFLLKLSSYTLKFRDEVLHSDHNKHWFCPGLTPHEIAEKVVDYCSNVDTPIEGDFSNFDGSVSAWLQRHVMNAVMLRYFGDDPELRGYLDMLVSCPARAKRFGFYYDAGVGVKSGSPTTCDLNTVLNGFIQFCAVVCCRPDLTHDECFRSIGLAFGDDSLFDAQYKTRFAGVAGELGMDLKIESTDPTRGVCFLARVFPDPRVSYTSFQDPLRTWRKLHITTRDPNVPLADAAMDRVEGYLVTDALTPVTSTYCRMIKRLYISQAGSVEIRSKRKSHNKEKPYWLTHEGGAWPQFETDRQLMLNCISARVGIDVEQLTELEHKLETMRDPFELTPVDREVPNPCANTMDEEGLPVAPVDPRFEQQQKDVVNLRSGGGTPESRGEDHGSGRSSDPGSGPVGISDGAAGPSGLQGRSDQPAPKAKPDRNGPPRKAQGGSIPQGRGACGCRPASKPHGRGAAKGVGSGTKSNQTGTPERSGGARPKGGGSPGKLPKLPQ